MLDTLRLTHFRSFGAQAPAFSLGALNLLVGANGAGKSSVLAALATLTRLPADLPGAVAGASWRVAPGQVAALRVTTGAGDGYALQVRTGPDGALQVRECLFDVGRDPGDADGPFGSPGPSCLGAATPRAARVRAELAGVELDDGAPLPAADLVARLRPLDSATRDRLDDALARFSDDTRGVALRGPADALEIVARDVARRPVPVSHLSRGTVRFLTLVTRLLAPDGGTVLGLEEPEQGLHPDVLPQIAELLRAASSRRQIVVTTHAETLLDSFSDRPDVVRVVARDATGSSVRAPTPGLYPPGLRLGQAWSAGYFGGNRW